MTVSIQNLSMIGCGLVGASILLAMKQQEKALPTTIYDASPETESLVRTRFEVDGFDSSHLTFTCNIADAVSNADLIILATPMNTFESVSHEIARHTKAGAILTDTGSAKKIAIKNIQTGIAGRTLKYVPAHPGNASQGIGASTASANNILGRNSTMYIIWESDANDSPPAASPEIVVQKFWNNIGTTTAFITSEKHDQFFGQCSHFQHAIMFVLMDMVKDRPEILYNFKHAGTALRNMSRVALGELKVGQVSSLARMWEPIFEQNKKPILESAERFSKYFADFIKCVKENDWAALTEKLTTAKKFRDRFDDPERREIITGELDDLRAILNFDPKNKGQLTASANTQSISALATNLLLPIAMSYAQLMSAHDIDPEFITQKANPSFLDGTHPSTYSVEYMMQLIQSQPTDLIQLADEFSNKLDKLRNAIYDHDGSYIRNMIHSAQNIRNTLPPVRKGNQVRKEYEVEPA